jgi:hypothetical protein
MKGIRLGLLLVALFACCKVSIAQEKLLRKSWIKASIEDFRGKHEPDTMYMRYVFSKSVVLFGFDPGWHYMQMPYAVNGNTLTLGIDQWTIETLTDTTLTIFLTGSQRIKFVAEGYLQTKDEYLIQIGSYSGKPLYKTNRVITPRYEKPNLLVDDVEKQDRSDDYNIRKAGTFLMSFIVTDDGKIEDPKILKGVASGFDKNIIKELLRTSKRWSPAMFKGQPVQTLMLFEIKFLDSLDE